VRCGISSGVGVKRGLKELFVFQGGRKEGVKLLTYVALGNHRMDFKGGGGLRTLEDKHKRPSSPAHRAGERSNICSFGLLSAISKAGMP